MLLRKKYTDLDSSFSALNVQSNFGSPALIKSVFIHKMSSIALSDLSFNQKIIRKYYQSKINCFPTMIFFNRKQGILSQKLNVDYLIRCHLRNKIEKHTLQFMKILIIPKGIQVISKPTVTSIFFKTSMFRFADTPEIEKENVWKYQPVIQPNFLRNINKLLTTAFSQQTYATSLGQKVNILFLVNRSTAKSVKDIPYLQNRNLLNISNFVIYKYSSTKNIENHHPVTSTKHFFKQKLRVLKEVPEKNNSIIFAEPIIKQGTFKYSSNSSRLTSLQEIYEFKDSDKFYFQDSRKIEQVLDKVNKVAIEVKEVLAKKNIAGDELRQIDINQVSDKVYQMIDYRLKIEKERRSHL